MISALKAKQKQTIKSFAWIYAEIQPLIKLSRSCQVSSLLLGWWHKSRASLEKWKVQVLMGVGEIISRTRRKSQHQNPLETREPCSWRVTDSPDCVYPIYLLVALTFCLWKSCKPSMHESVFWSCSICATESIPEEHSHLSKEQKYCEEELYTISNWLAWGRQETEKKFSITQVQWVNSTPWWPFLLQLAA